MNTLTRIQSIAGVAITAIVLGGFSLNSRAAAKKAPETNARELAATQAAKKLTPTQKTKMLALLNEGDASALQAIRGIGKSRATALAKARPFKSVAQLVNVKGIGQTVYSDLLAHAKSLTARRTARQPAKASTSGRSKATSGAKTKSAKSKGD